MPKYQFKEPEPHEPGKSNRRACRTCGREIREHKQKVFGMWVCDLVLMSNGHWVHSSRVDELMIKHNLEPVQRLSEA